MRRLGIITALSMLVLAVSASVALAAITTTINPANAPGSSHFASGSASCTVNANNSIACSGYVLGGVGHTNATVSLVASYSATIDCTNKGGNLVESHTSNFSADSTASVASTKNGQLSVPAQSVSPFGAPQVCPNPNWTPTIRGGTVTLNSFTYTLTFDGFSGAYITITGP